jgi:hypothetical protein
MLALQKFFGECTRQPSKVASTPEASLAPPPEAAAVSGRVLLGRGRTVPREVPVDGTTKVPADLYNSLLKAGDRAKVRGGHTLEVEEKISNRNSGKVRLVKTTTNGEKAGINHSESSRSDSS